MKDSKDNRGDGSNQRSAPGTNVVETGPLFPRLHVKETKRVGPRAPPRNKMALYEQFTFPSNRFVPPLMSQLSSGRPAGSSPNALVAGSKTAPSETFTFPSHRFGASSISLQSSGHPSGSSLMPQGSPYDISRYYCPPLGYGNVGLPYMAMNVSHGGVQPSLNGTDSSMIIDGDSELQRAPSGPTTDSAGHSLNGPVQARGRVSTHTNLRSVSSKKARSNDDGTVPIYNVPETTSAFRKVYSEASELVTREPWQQPDGIHISRAYQALDASYNYQGESAGAITQRVESRADLVARMKGVDRSIDPLVSGKTVHGNQAAESSEMHESMPVGTRKEKQVVHLRRWYSENSGVQAIDTECNIHRKTCQKAGHCCEDTLDGECVRSSGTGNGDCVSVLEDIAERGTQQDKRNSKRNISKEVVVIDLPPDHTQSGSHGNEKKQQSLGVEKSRKQPLSGGCTANTPYSSNKELENSRNDESSEHKQPVSWSDSEESDGSMIESAPVIKITPKDVIDSVGQQEFWKARKLLQRHQTIFSSQVFELHRLIKVQQILAASENTLCGVMHHDVSQPTQDVIPEKVKGKKTVVENQASRGSEQGKKNGALGKQLYNHCHDGEQDTSKRKTGKQLHSTCQSSSSSRAHHQPSMLDMPQNVENAGQDPLPPSSGIPGPSAWGCPPIMKSGGNHWFGALPALNNGFMYQPYPGVCRQPQMNGYNGACQPVMCGPSPMDLPTMASYGMPGYDQRPDFMQNMYSYNAMQPQWQPAMFCPPAASWYIVPPMTYVEPTQKNSPGWYNEMAGSHPPGHPVFHRTANPSSAPIIPPSQTTAYMENPQRADAATTQEGVREVDDVRSPVQWPLPAVSCQTSEAELQTRAACTSGQDSGPSGSEQVDDGWEKVWDGSGRQYPEEKEGDAPAGAQSKSTDAPESRVPKRLRDGGVGVRSPRHRDRQTPGKRDALPLFPLIPVSNSNEKEKLSNQSYAGVIKAVPYAMVATAESAAEILLSIQKQRQQ